MASPAQIAANRKNSLKSTGPTSAAGKAVCRFNALKSGIHAESMTIPGEAPAELAELADNYHQCFQPADPVERFLVDALIDADWKLRRYRKVEANICRLESNSPAGLPENSSLPRLHRRMDGAERSYYRALRELKSRRAASPEIGSVPSQPEAPVAAQPEPRPEPPTAAAPTPAAPPDYVKVPPVGSDAAPEFRIFYPITLADMILFDRNPELAASLHKPWNPATRSGK